MISIIVPVYNAGIFLERCLDSICRQTYKEIEVILINDGSTDGSTEICEAYVKKDSRVKVLSKGNEGVVKARKDGLKIASGEYIGYVDADDWIEPDM
ncbi:MAG TPA: glycosyl transferase family 2, partial [Lachnospiraceae bacterium]|nr:glycosyl transferase family 2 [Lachnospiraceae bacterium]